MKNRREFLQIGVAALALPIAAHTAGSSAPAAGQDRSVPLYKVVFDERFADSRAFGTEAERLGLPVYKIKGDITDLWFHDLYVRWKKSPAAIAGLTAHGPIFCLERLAWDQGMRVIFRGEHKVLSVGEVEHSLSGPGKMLRDAANLSAKGQSWSAGMARLVAGCPIGGGQDSKISIKTIVPNSADLDSETLISWVIAPVRTSSTIGRST
jgi:hypothetical protein